MSQILQGLAIKYAVEHWRRNMPRSMGALYWQLNDCWPVASWSSLDYHGRPKALHYAARRFYAPLLVSAVEDWQRSTVEIHLTNDRSTTARGKLRWLLSDVGGKPLEQGTFPVRVAARTSRKLRTLNLKKHAHRHHGRNLMLWLEFVQAGKIVSSQLVTFYKPKSIELKNPTFQTQIQADKDGAFQLSIKAQNPAMWVWIELAHVNAHCSDNFFHLRPGRTKTVRVRPEEKLTLKQMEKKLKIKSFFDLY